AGAERAIGIAAEIDRVGEAVAGGVADPAQIIGVERIITVARHDLVVLLIFAADVEVEALLGEAAIADRRVDALLGAIATIGDAGRRIQVNAGDFLLHDHVDHARDRVGAVGRRCAVLQDFDAVHDGIGDRVEIDEVAVTVIG
ncbi:hypothetical protein QU38_01295, partial [Staphylococcus aureus]